MNKLMIIGYTILGIVIFIPSQYAFAAKEKSPANDHQTCISEWAEAKSDGENAQGRSIGLHNHVASLERQIKKLHEALALALSKIPDAN